MFDPNAYGMFFDKWFSENFPEHAENDQIKRIAWKSWQQGQAEIYKARRDSMGGSASVGRLYDKVDLMRTESYSYKRELKIDLDSLFKLKDDQENQD